MNHKNTPLIISGIIAVLLAGFVVRPLFLSIKQNSEILLGQKATLAELEEKGENLKRFQSTYDVYKDNLEKMDKLFIDKEEPVDFIKFLEKEAAAFKLTIDLTPLTLKVGEAGNWPSTSFQIDMAGSFPDFLKFLDKIESSASLTALSDFSLNKPPKSSNGDIVISFQMRVYTK